MKAQDCLIKIQSNGCEINLILGTTQSNNEIDLLDFVQHTDVGGKFFQQGEETQLGEMQKLKNTARVLEEHIDTILMQIHTSSLLTLNRLLFNYMLLQNRVIV